MDIFFCDECGTRVTDLDLRAGRGMRRRHDTICPGCVDLGKAQDWLTRHPEAAPAAAVAQANGNGHAQAAVAVAERPDPIAVARDRAVTQPEDDFLVDEPEPLKPVSVPSAPMPPPTFETDRLESPRAKAAPPAVAPPPPPVDGLASAGGGFGALVGASARDTGPAMVDDPEERAAEALPQSQPETPFDFVAPEDADNPGKTETAEVEVPVKPDKAETVKVGSGKHAAQSRRGNSTSKVTAAKGTSTSRQAKAIKTPSTRQASPNGGGTRTNNTKVMYLSLASLGLMLIIFFVFVLPGASKGGDRTPQVIVDQPLQVLEAEIKKAKEAAGKALQTDDIATARYGLQCILAMEEAFQTFEKAAGPKWNEDAYGVQLQRMGYYDVRSMKGSVRHRIGIIEQRGKE